VAWLRSKTDVFAFLKDQQITMMKDDERTHKRWWDDIGRGKVGRGLGDKVLV
jgi:hypothetical protein